MKNEEKLKALGGIDPEFIDSAARLKKKKSPLWGIGIAAAAALCLGLGTFLAASMLADKSDEKTASADPTPVPIVTEAPTAEPPEKTDAPAHTDDPSDVGMIVPAMELPEGVSASFAAVPDVPNTFGKSGYYTYMSNLRRSWYHAGDTLAGFYGKTTAEFLLSGEEGENTIYSPFNVYMALAMMAETASGETRAQILDLLGASSIEALREQANRLFVSNYFDNDVLTILPAAALWIDSSSTPYLKADVLNTLSNEYHSSTFIGDMEDPEFTKLCRKWLNEQTHDLLTDQVEELELKPGELMHLITTLYYKAGWANEFIASRNTVEPFHSPAGDEQATFMHGGADSYRELNGFSIAAKMFNEYANIWFVLPDEGVDLDTVIAEGKALDVILSGSDEGRVDGAIIHLNLPKFDVESKLDLVKGLKNLGVTYCFDAEKADFTELTDLQDVCISNITHGVRVIADEEGVEAAAYTDVGYAGSAEPIREVDFTLDRPFMFVITSPDGTPLFVGTVYHPGA